MASRNSSSKVTLPTSQNGKVTLSQTYPSNAPQAEALSDTQQGHMSHDGVSTSFNPVVGGQDAQPTIRKSALAPSASGSGSLATPTGVNIQPPGDPETGEGGRFDSTKTVQSKRLLSRKPPKTSRISTKSFEAANSNLSSYTSRREVPGLAGSPFYDNSAILPLIDSRIGPDGLSPIFFGNSYPLGGDDITEQYSYRRSPALLLLSDGRLMAFITVRDGENDYNGIAMAYRLSSDLGETWGDENVIPETEDTPASASDRVQVGQINVIENADNEVVFVYERNPKGLASPDPGGPVTADLQIPRVFMTKASISDLNDWSTPLDITNDMKVRATTPGVDSELPLGHPFLNEANAEWTQVLSGPEGFFKRPMGEISNTLYLAGYYRMENHGSIDGSYPQMYCSRSLDGGITWQMMGGPTVSQANTVNETQGLLLSSKQGDRAGYLYSQSRSTALNGQRNWSQSTDNGVTWDDIGVHSELVSSRSKGSVVEAKDGTLWCTYPGDDIYRKTLMIQTSTDGGLTWGNPKRLLWCWVAYSSIIEVAPNEFAVMWEGGAQGDPESGAAQDTTSRGVYFTKFNKEWYESEDETPYFDWHFNEGLDGEIPHGIDVFGVSIPDRSPYGMDAVPFPASPATATDLVYTDVGGDTMLNFNGGYVRLARGESFAMSSIAADESFSIEGVLTTTTAVGPDVVFNVDGHISIVTLGGQLYCTVEDDDTNEETISSTSLVNDGAKHSFAFVRDKDSGLLYLYVDGVSDATPLADPTGAMDAAEVGKEVRVGNGVSTSFPFEGNIGRITFYRDKALKASEVQTAESLLSSRVEPSWVTDAATPAEGPGLFGSLVFWVPDWSDDRSFQFNQQGGDIPVKGAVYGTQARSVITYGPDRLLARTNPSGSEDSATRALSYIEDANLGGMYHHTSNSTYSTFGGMSIPNTADTDWVRALHNDAIGTISFWVKKTSPSPNSLYGFATLDPTGTPSGSGVAMFISHADGDVQIRLYQNGVAAQGSGDTSTISADPGDVLQFFAVVFRGFSDKPYLYHAVYSDSSPTQTEITPTWSDPGESDTDSEYDFHLGGQPVSAAHTQSGGMYSKYCVFDSSLTEANVQTLFDWGKGL